MKRVIAHLDMDAFFASVEQRDNPSLKGKPVIVGADPKGGHGRGVVATCSYEARAFGIHSAMPISQAYKLCPQGIYLTGNGRKYKQASNQIFAILRDFTPDVEPVSIDEAFMDLTGCVHLHGSARVMAERIKERILKEVRLPASIGIAPNKFLAKMASDASKPNGLLEIHPEGVTAFLWPLPVEKLWGVGPKTKASLNAIGIRAIKDLAQYAHEDIVKRYGEHGDHLYRLAHGLDDRDVYVDETIKSVSHEHTFDKDTRDLDVIHEELSYLCEKTSRRLRKHELKGKTISLKIRLKGFKTYTRAETLSERTHFDHVIYKEAKELFDAFYQPGMAVRLIGVRVSNFEDPYIQESLFTDPSSEKLKKVYQAIDHIKDKFGEASIHHANTRKH